MRLLFYITSLRGGGAERVMSILCNKFVEKGYEVYIATNTKQNFVYELDKRIHVVSLYPENYEKLPKIYRLLKFYSLVRSIARQIKPDIIVSFAHNVCLAVVGLSIPVIQSEHTTFARKVSRKFDFERLYINKLATKVTVLTQYDYNLIGKCLPQKVIMPNPLTFHPLSAVPAKNKVILAAGRLDIWKIKGFDTLIKTWSLIADRYPDWQVEIAGTGKEENLNKLKALAEKLGVVNSVHFLGFRSDVDKLMRDSSIFVLTSRYEGFGMVLLEAMSQGCTCVSFDCMTGPREIITHNWDGLLVSNQSEEKMSGALSLLIENEKLRYELADHALQTVRHYMPDTIVERWDGLFEELLNRKK